MPTAAAHPLLGERTRLLIMSTVATASEPVDFMQLIELLALSRGNLSVHLRKLEEAGLLLVEKQFVDRKPCTRVSCTEAGRSTLRSYLEEVERLLKQI